MSFMKYFPNSFRLERKKTELLYFQMSDQRQLHMV